MRPQFKVGDEVVVVKLNLLPPSQKENLWKRARVIGVVQNEWWYIKFIGGRKDWVTCDMIIHFRDATQEQRLKVAIDEL